MPQDNVQPPKSIFKSAIMPKSKRPGWADKLAKFEADMAGSGQYVYENNTKGDLMLPKITKSGRKSVRVGEQFIGDSYFMQMVKTHELKYIKTLIPAQSKQEGVVMPEKLIVEQPPTVTPSGTVEQVIGEPTKLNEEEKMEKDDILMNESPIGGIQILS